LKHKILGLDIGSINTGIAISDSTKSIAFSYSTISTESLEIDIKKIIELENINKIIVGKNLYQSKNFQVEDYVKKYLPKDIDVIYINEDFSTHKAKEIAEAKGLTDKEFKQKKDELAAQVILQDYLDQF